MSDQKNADIILYSKTPCVQCDATERALRKKGVDYRKVDVSKDEAAYDHIVGLGFRQVPVVEHGETRWSGFRPDMISKLPVKPAVEPEVETAAEPGM